jgi:hypothetical protein
MPAKLIAAILLTVLAAGCAGTPSGAGQMDPLLVDASLIGPRPARAVVAGPPAP